MVIEKDKYLTDTMVQNIFNAISLYAQKIPLRIILWNQENNNELFTL